MATIIPIGQPQNEAEREAIRYLRNHLPQTFTIIHNFELSHGGEHHEIDLIVLAPHCVYVVDVKGVHGNVIVQGPRWYPEGRGPYLSPLAKARMVARKLHGFLLDSYKTNPATKGIYVHQTVLLPFPNANIIDTAGNEQNDIVHLNKSLVYFQNKSVVLQSRSTNIGPLHHLIIAAIQGKARPQTQHFGKWRIEERLGGNEHYTEYRAHHIFMGKGQTARLRVYRADPYQDPETRQREQKVISNAYRVIGNAPGHPNILTVKDFFDNEDSSYFVLVTEDAKGNSLRQHISNFSLSLTFDQKLRVIRDVLTALEHAHNNGIIHRNLTPDAILVGEDKRARLSSFEYARAKARTTSTIAPYIVEKIDEQYQAPESYKEPAQASAASDLFSAGLVFYELLTSETAFNSMSQIFDNGAVFPIKPTEHRPELPSTLDDWLQRLCAFEPHKRFTSAAEALERLTKALASNITPEDQIGQPTPTPTAQIQPQDKRNLSKKYVINSRFIVEERLGIGAFGVAYKVFDTLAEAMRVLKLVLSDRISVTQRLQQEYKTLSRLPDHQYVVKTYWADFLPDGTPFIVFDYVDGLSVSDLVESKTLTFEDALKIGSQVAEGLIYLHSHGVYHLDIKPSNLIWSDQGVRIIDFNVSVSDQDESMIGGGTSRYIPPGMDYETELSYIQKVDRDLYALGVTLYECFMGQYPFKDPALRKVPTDPTTITGSEELHPDVFAFLFKSISPDTRDRFHSASDFLSALQSLLQLRKIEEILAPEPCDPQEIRHLPEKPNTNPFVDYLLTLYSQSQRTNAGTRGLDAQGERIYIDTFLDKKLQPTILTGSLQLVIISGNAGDGKTAFIQRLAKSAEQLGAHITYLQNGFTFDLEGHSYLSNYDGSQDEGEKTNDEVLLTFLGPFSGSDEKHWPTKETRLIAINEGRLIDFLSDHEKQFSRLAEIVRKGLTGATTPQNIAVINLNLRSVVIDLETKNDSIFDHLIRRMTEPRFWEACEGCDLKQRCYIYHNAHTFMDPVTGPKTIERLKTLYTVTHLRGKLHITLRDLRSALAYMLVGTLDCQEIHKLYSTNTQTAQQQIMDSFYFNSWMGGSHTSNDRLLSLLKEIDIAEISNPDLDRDFDFMNPQQRELRRFTYTGRGSYDAELLHTFFQRLPREYNEKTRAKHMEQHRNYVAMSRRRYFFEGRNKRWREMLPYEHFSSFLLLVKGKDQTTSVQVQDLLQAINQGEGLIDPVALGNTLALRVRHVEKGTIQSYRLFKGDAFSISQQEQYESIRFIEYLPQAIYLRYQPEMGSNAELRITLDIYEMLMRLKSGYRPSPEELQGFYLSLTIFKNVLSSAPYQEVLLTETGHTFYIVRKSSDGRLSIEQR